MFKVPYTVSISNYTSLFESELNHIHFLKKPQSKRMFTAYNRIRNEMNLIPLDVNIKFIKYYQTNFNCSELYADKIYQIDINSCYPTILKNNFIISPTTFDFIQSLDKNDKLAAIGMLASKKNIFTYDGENIEHRINKNPLSDYFFFCVQETYKIMNDCRDLIGNNFLFSWVDAIYFTGGSKIANKIINFLWSEHKLKSSFNTLYQFEVELRKDFYRLRYIKDNQATFMNIPTIEQNEKRDLINYLLNKKYNNENN